jgi:hypothetical protein
MAVNLFIRLLRYAVENMLVLNNVVCQPKLKFVLFIVSFTK